MSCNNYINEAVIFCSVIFAGGHHTYLITLLTQLISRSHKFTGMTGHPVLLFKILTGHIQYIHTLPYATDQSQVTNNLLLSFNPSSIAVVVRIELDDGPMVATTLPHPPYYNRQTDMFPFRYTDQPNPGICSTWKNNTDVGILRPP